MARVRVALALSSGQKPRLSLRSEVWREREAASCDQPLQHRVQALAAGGGRDEMRWAYLEEACADQRGESGLTHGLDGIGAGICREDRAVDALAEAQAHHQRFLHQVAAGHQRTLGRAMTVALDRLQPRFRSAVPARGVLALTVAEAAMRARADTDVILIPPVDQIMAARRARSRVVGNFISRQPGLFETGLRELEHLGRQFLGRQDEGATRMLREEARAALD